MIHEPKVQLNAGKVRAALGDADTPAFVLLVIAMHTFGDEFLGDPEQGVEAMDPSEVWAGLNEVYGTWVTEEGENKLNALWTALQGDLFYRDVEVFSAVCTALYDGDLGDIIDAGFVDLTATEIMWAILEVELARDDEEGPPQFSLGVQDIIDREIRAEQEDKTVASENVSEAYHAMLDQLLEIGVPESSLRLLDREYTETLSAINAPSVP